MTYQNLYEYILAKQSYLCVGLDTDLEQIPKYLHQKDIANAIFEFNRQIIDATLDYCVAYKINTAFYEAQGLAGWQAMTDTLNYIPKTHFTIADAKRGDIGNTSDNYAKAFFKQMDFDSITVAPYMGADSVKPFLNYADKWVILLALTSNASSSDFQFLEINGEKLFEKVLQTSQTWADHTQMMYVVGATQTAMLANIRKIVPQHFLLVPGVGSQGGSLEEVSHFGLNEKVGLLVNASRSIIYASADVDFAKAAQNEAQKIQTEMKGYLAKY